MPYLDEAARQLGISEKTLRRWLTLVDPPITPTRHRYNLRYHLITAEEVERIREARAQMPGATPQANMPPARLTAKSGRSTPLADSFPIPAADRRLDSPLSASFSLPDGMMSKKQAAEIHGIPRETLAGWCRSGKVETDPGEYPGARGHWKIVQPITQKGLAQLYRLASRRPDFTPCDRCPHDE